MNCLIISVLFFVIIAMGAAEVKEVKFEELRDGLNNNSLVYLDVRNRDELRTDGKVVGSVVVPLPEVEHAFNLEDAEFLDKYGFSKPARDATNVVVGCRSGRRAVTAIGTLEKLGYTTLRIYKGSFLDWQAKGGPITKE
ncbi:rhodanese domain-containing protein CG4456 [Daphnia magna]|uniref:Rhodanese domain-containing protein n=1 Tax=Daphnia magna TaxID=35525 RepID=A0ABR0AMK2_9CRUS|nr:rhodanese domain-containing protein CG4456 [Daphnia magna]KAK4026330.1 hypothetical protein OUZ56_015336 [Daphnia magna]